MRNGLERLRQPPLPNNIDEQTRAEVLRRRPRIFNAQGHPQLDPNNPGPWSQKALDQALKGQTNFATIREENTDLRILTAPIIRNNEVAAAIQVAADLRPVNAMRSTLFTVLALLLPASLIIAGIGGSILTRRAIKPIEELTQTAREIGKNDLSQRIKVTGNDEFAELGEEFNGMVARLQASFEKQQQLLNDQRRFTADASHELRTPLTRIKLVTSSAQSDDDLAGEVKERFEVIETATDHMTHLVEQMLTLARLENAPLTAEPFNIQTVFTRAVQLANLQGDPRLTVSTTDLVINANPILIERAILNLLTNAARHTANDQSITLSAAIESNQVTITVIDTGEGIASQHLEKLTTRFYRIDTARNSATGGTGLGLSIVESIARSHGGTLKIQSQPNQGTTVQINFPVV